MTSNGSKYYQAHLWSLGQEDQQSRQVLAATLALFQTRGVLKWGFTCTFPWNQEAMLKQMSELSLSYFVSF